MDKRTTGKSWLLGQVPGPCFHPSSPRDSAHPSSRLQLEAQGEVVNVLRETAIQSPFFPRTSFQSWISGRIPWLEGMQRCPSRAPKKGNRKCRQPRPRPRPRRADPLRPLLSGAAVLPGTCWVESEAGPLGSALPLSAPLPTPLLGRSRVNTGFLGPQCLFPDPDLGQARLSGRVAGRPSQPHPGRKAPSPGPLQPSSSSSLHLPPPSSAHNPPDRISLSSPFSLPSPFISLLPAV